MILDEEEYLEHYGVKGMRWGVRSNRTEGVSRSTDRMAKKDAEESARAKMFYGEGAGTRRKLIRETVKARSKDPAYAKAFNAHLTKQDLSTHASKAVRERTTTDRRNRNKKRAGYLARRFTGEMGTQAAFAAAALGGVGFLNSPRGRAIMSTGYNAVRNTYLQKQGARHISDFLRNYS